MSLNDNIDAFVTYYGEHIQAAKSLDVGDKRSNLIYKKLLLSAIIDGMSKPFFPPLTRNNVTFTSFLQQFSDWSDGTRISLPHLLRFIDTVADSALDQLKSFASERIATWLDGEFIPPNQDPDISEIQRANLWPSGRRYPLGDWRVTLESFRHVNLFYAFRNSLAHELRPRGLGVEFPEDSEPYYISVSELDSSLKLLPGRWTLIYPLAFFVDRAEKSLAKLGPHLTNHGIDPLSRLSIGDYWIDGLN